MADGPVANLPAGLDAYGGYVNRSGVGVTYPEVVANFPKALHLSITTDGAPAMCADVEKGAMTNWSGYDYGYCSVSNVNSLVTAYGRPRKLWTSHYDPKFGAHICSSACWPGLVTTADGTQWVDHGGWDESLLDTDFFADPEEDMNYSDDDINVDIRSWWNEYHTDPMTGADQAFLLGQYHGAYAGSRDKLLAGIVDLAASKGTLRPDKAGSV